MSTQTETKVRYQIKMTRTQWSHLAKIAAVVVQPIDREPNQRLDTSSVIPMLRLIAAGRLLVCVNPNPPGGETENGEQVQERGV